MNPVIIFLVIIFLLILIGTYYWYTAYEIQVFKHEVKKPVTNEVKMCTLSNYYNGIIETRVINVISDGGELYFYSHKNSKHVEQLKDNNRVTLLMYTKDGNINKQVVIDGNCEQIKQLDDLILYKVFIKNRKISVTYDEKDIQVTNYSYNNNYGRELRCNYKEISELVKYAKDHATC